MSASGKKSLSPEDKIMDLFQSHSLLKQEFKQLESDNTLLTKQKKDNEKKIAALEGDLYKLEKYLTKIQHYEDIKAYYQLRLVWRTCNRYIHKFRDRLVDQQSDRERKQQLLEFNQKKSKALNQINDRITNAKNVLDTVSRRVHDLNTQLESMNMPWHILSKRNLRRERAQAYANETSSYSELQELYDERMKIDSEPWPEFEGLDFAGKRSINLAMIALAQYFFVGLSEFALANKCLHAYSNPVWEVSYGEPAKQKLIIQTCENKLKYFSELKDLSSEVQNRMSQLKEEVSYSKDTDSIPATESITKVVNDFSGAELYNTLTDVSFEVNVIEENYWGLKDLMIP